jgi:hypothetical protein
MSCQNGEKWQTSLSRFADQPNFLSPRQSNQPHGCGKDMRVYSICVTYSSDNPVSKSIRYITNFRMRWAPSGAMAMFIRGASMGQSILFLAMSNHLYLHPLFKKRAEYLSRDDQVLLSYQRARLVMQTYSKSLSTSSLASVPTQTNRSFCIRCAALFAQVLGNDDRPNMLGRYLHVYHLGRPCRFSNRNIISASKETP